MLYRPNSDHARRVEEFANMLSRNYVNYKLDLVDLNSRDGAATASLYDVMEYPAVLVLTSDGQLVKEWHGNSMPLSSEVSFHART